MENGYTYLVQQDKYYKIGFTTNVKKRMAAYDTHAPNFTLLGCIPGNCEKELHKKFSEYHYKKEWFNENQDILNEFNKNGVNNLYELMTEDNPVEGQKQYIDYTRLGVDIATAVEMCNHGYDELSDNFVKITHDKNGVEDDKIECFSIYKDYGIKELNICRNSSLEKFRKENNDADYYVTIPSIGEAIQWMIDKYKVFINISYIIHQLDNKFYFKYELIDLNTGMPYKNILYNGAVNEYFYAVCCAINKFFEIEDKKF